MADIITFRPSPQDKVALGRIMREHPYLNRNVSAAIRVGLAAYHELQILKEQQALRLAADALAQDLALRFQQARWIESGAATGDASRFDRWLVGLQYPSAGAFGEAMLKDKALAATSLSPQGDPLARWFVLDDLIIGQSFSASHAWYIVPLTKRLEMPAIDEFQEK